MLLVEQPRIDNLTDATDQVSAQFGYGTGYSGRLAYLRELDEDPSQVARRFLAEIDETPESLGWAPYPYADAVTREAGSA